MLSQLGQAGAGSDDAIERVITSDDAERLRYWLMRNGFIDYRHRVTPEWQARMLIADYPEPHFPEDLRPYLGAIEAIVDSGSRGETPPAQAKDLVPNLRLKERFELPQFRTLWDAISRTSWFDIAAFDSDGLIKDAIEYLNEHLQVTRPRLLVTSGIVAPVGDAPALSEDRRSAEALELASEQRARDLVGEVAAAVGLTRRTCAAILGGLSKEKFVLYKVNPPQFVKRVAEVILDLKNAAMVEHVQYRVRDESKRLLAEDVFPDDAAKAKKVRKDASPEPKKNVLQYLPTLDSAIERWFVLGYDGTGSDALSRQLRERFDPGIDNLDEVVAWAKLPKPEFSIATPLGRYTPDWAVAAQRKDGSLDVYMVVETKSTTRQGGLRPDEHRRIEAAKKHFEAVNKAMQDVGASSAVTYHLADSLSAIRDLVLGTSVSGGR